MASPARSEDLERRVAQLDWYHTMELPGDVVTPGLFDHRPVLDSYGFPSDFTGLRVLDVGTFDGFFAFEFERRGAAEVVATDISDRDALDWPVPLKRRSIDRFQPRQTNFDLARDALGSSVKHLSVSAYDVAPERLGSFDFVFVGSLLIHLRDPVGALMALHAVCRDDICVAEPTHRRIGDRRLGKAQFRALDNDLTWWVPDRKCLAQWIEAAGFVDVRCGRTFTIPFRGRRGGIRHSVIRARPGPRNGMDQGVPRS